MPSRKRKLWKSKRACLASIISPLVTPGLTNHTGWPSRGRRKSQCRWALPAWNSRQARCCARSRLPHTPLPMPMQKVPLDPGTHARAEGIGRGRMELLRFIGRITLITQGNPHVTVVRIGLETYGNAGIPYFNMIPQGGSSGVGAHERGTHNGTPVVSGGRGNLSQHCPCHWRHWHLFRLQRFCPQKGRTYHLNS